MPRTLSWRWLPASAWAALILAVSSIPGRDLTIPPGSDKFGHLGEYGVLGVLAAFALGRGASMRARAASWGAVALFAALDELHQVLIPGRSADPLDWLADVAGATLGMLALAAWHRWRPGPQAAP